jgi:hypothetical protein
LFLAKSFFAFSTENDGYYIQAYGKEMGSAFVEALKADRKSLFMADLLRSGFFMVVAFGALWFYIKGKLAQNTAIIIVGVFMVGDLFFVDKNYVSNNPGQFKSAREINEPFQASPADEEILKDTSVFRVYELQGRLQGRTSYFHKSVGGYSAVRPRRYDQLFEYQIDKKLADLGNIISPETMSLTKSISILNAMNVKYLLIETKDGQSVPIVNPYINGNAWFVEKVNFVNSADQEMKALDNLDTKKIAVINTLVADGQDFKGSENIVIDSTATIALNLYKPNHVKYTSNNKNYGFAVFSETYYKNGWKATIDGKEAKILNVDYVLRGLEIPAGKHSIEFKFEPQVIKTGSTIALFSAIGVMLLLMAGVYFEMKKKKQE